MNRIVRMFRNSVAIVALGAVIAPTVAQASSLGGILHLHPKPAVPDTRISFTLFNEAVTTREVMVAGKTYSVQRHRLIEIKAPVGTRVYVVSPEVSHARGSVLVEVTPAIANHRISVD
jgi:hypothetical protein